jgi:hypothetical protein
MEDRHTSRCPNSVLIIAHDGMEVCDGAHWLFVMKRALDPVSEEGNGSRGRGKNNGARALGWKRATDSYFYWQLLILQKPARELGSVLRTRCRLGGFHG